MLISPSKPARWSITLFVSLLTHIAKLIRDAFNSSGIGIGSTLTEIPALRIDYIFHDKNFESANYKKINKKLSDHFAISCELKIKKN